MSHVRCLTDSYNQDVLTICRRSLVDHCCVFTKINWSLTCNFQLKTRRYLQWLKVCFILKIIDGTFQIEITFNYVDRSLNLRGGLSTKNMNYGENIQKLINDDSYIKKWRNFLNFVFNRLKKIKTKLPNLLRIYF